MEQLSSNAKLNEVKRKIALVEGKRRALQSSFERENKGNRAALAKLGEEVQVHAIGKNRDISDTARPITESKNGNHYLGVN